MKGSRRGFRSIARSTATLVFLTHLATARRVSAPTQTQALCAILFLYKNVLGREIGELELVRARRRRKIPVVLTREEVRAVLDHLERVPKLFCTLLYGTGLRLMEGLRLRCGAL